MSAGCKTQIISEIRERVSVFTKNAKFIINLDQTMNKIYIIFIEKAKKKKKMQSTDRDFENKKIHFIGNLKLVK